MGQMEKNPQAPCDWHGWDPTAYVLCPPRPHAGAKPLPFQWHPRWRDRGCWLLPRAIRASDGWLGKMDQAASLSVTPVVGRSSSFFQEVACGERPQATFRPSGLAVCRPHAVEEVTEELVPEEHEAGGERSLQQAGGQALVEAAGTLLLQHLPGAVQEAPIASNLGRRGLGEERGGDNRDVGSTLLSTLLARHSSR